jgi:hypothetical protein
MRLVVLAAISALGLGLLAMSGASAMPANGVAIDHAAPAPPLAEPVWWRYRYRWRRWHYWRRW